MLFRNRAPASDPYERLWAAEGRATRWGSGRRRRRPGTSCATSSVVTRVPPMSYRATPVPVSAWRASCSRVPALPCRRWSSASVRRSSGRRLRATGRPRWRTSVSRAHAAPGGAARVRPAPAGEPPRPGGPLLARCRARRLLRAERPVQPGRLAVVAARRARGPGRSGEVQRGGRPGVGADPGERSATRRWWRGASQRSATAKATDGSRDGAAAAHGVASALALWRAVTGDGATVDGFLAGVAEARTARTARPRRRRRGSPAPHGHCWLGSCAPAATRDAWRRPSAPARGRTRRGGATCLSPPRRTCCSALTAPWGAPSIASAGVATRRRRRRRRSATSSIQRRPGGRRRPASPRGADQPRVRVLTQVTSTSSAVAPSSAGGTTSPRAASSASASTSRGPSTRRR